MANKGWLLHMAHPIVWVFPAAVMSVGTSLTWGQDYPNRTVRLVTVSPGSANDLAARFVAQELRGALGQSVIVDNRGGIAAEIVAKAPPDGYTVLLYGSAVWLAPFLQSSESSHHLKNLTPITLVASSPNILVVHPSLPVKSVKDLIALAKRRPGQLNYAAGSLGAAPHLASELFKSMAGVNIVRVPYKGTGPSMIGLIGGEVELMFPTAGSAGPHVKSGKMRALAVTSLTPSALAPGLPTLAESLPGYESVSLNGMFAPAKTPAAVIALLNQEVVRILTRADAKERLFSAGMDAVVSTPDEFGAIIKSEMIKWGKVIRDAGIRDE
jgi:tripartite-type tricarboxylate transporter receptor subunit TctC